LKLSNVTARFANVATMSCRAKKRLFASVERRSQLSWGELFAKNSVVGDAGGEACRLGRLDERRGPQT